MRLQHLHPPPDAAGEVRPQISFSYTYRVNGSGYVGDSYSYLEKSPAAEIPLPHGKQIPVFYNPAAPADAVLSREVTADDFEKMLQLTLLNLMGFSFLGLWTRGRARKIFSVPQLWQS